jgi:hypothetical protein
MSISSDLAAALRGRCLQVVLADDGQASRWQAELRRVFRRRAAAAAARRRG